MKIVILTDQIAGGGGAGVVAWNHAKALHAHGHEVVALTTTEKKELVGVRKEEGITVHTFYSKYNLLFRAYISLNNHRLVREVAEVLAQVKPDIIHAHNLHLHFSYAVLREAKKHTDKVFLTIHDSMPFHYSKLYPETVRVEQGIVKSYKVSPWTQFRLFKWQYNPFRNFLIRKYLASPTKIFAVSAALAQALEDNGIENVEVLNNGIDVKEWEVAGNPQENKKYIFLGGRLSAVKGGNVAMEALKIVAEKYRDVQLLVVGEENDYARKLMKNAEEVGVKNLITFTGYKNRNEMKEMYARATLVIVPSLCFDWFPTIILEAMASHKPVIATCFGGSREMVVDGVTGFIINPQNVEELSRKITYLLDNPEKAHAMGEAGCERVSKEFSMEKHMEKLFTWYDKNY